MAPQANLFRNERLESVYDIKEELGRYVHVCLSVLNLFYYFLCILAFRVIIQFLLKQLVFNYSLLHQTIHTHRFSF